MTAAPETETDANGIVALLDEHLPGDYTHMFFADPGAVDPPVDCRCGHRREWGVSHHQHLAGIIATAARERVRVVEGERDAWRETAVTMSNDYHRELDLRIDATARAESAEAAHAALRAEVEALARKMRREAEGMRGTLSGLAVRQDADALDALLAGGGA